MLVITDDNDNTNNNNNLIYYLTKWPIELSFLNCYFENIWVSFFEKKKSRNPKIK